MRHWARDEELEAGSVWWWGEVFVGVEGGEGGFQQDDGQLQCRCRHLRPQPILAGYPKCLAVDCAAWYI